MAECENKRKDGPGAERKSGRKSRSGSSEQGKKFIELASSVADLDSRGSIPGRVAPSRDGEAGAGKRLGSAKYPIAGLRTLASRVSLAVMLPGAARRAGSARQRDAGTPRDCVCVTD